MTPDRSDVVLYGLRIRSAVPLPDGRPAAADGAVDLDITLGPSIAVGSSPPAGEVLAEHALSDEEWSCFVRRAGGEYLLRYAPVCDIVVDAALRRAVVHPMADAPLERLSVFASGALPAFVLLMRGEPVLHASAVDVGGSVVAFVGQSGMGKSTMATLACAQGARLVTDDVLRVDVGPPPRCHLGGGELRLRRARALLDDLGLTESRPTGDGRDAVPLPVSDKTLTPLAAIVIPLLDRAATDVDVQRLPPVDAVLALLSFPRFAGWQETTSQTRQLQLLADVSTHVGVFTARLPWGPPFPATLIDDVLAGAGVTRPPPRRAR
jgi:hypothetical protein